MPVGGQIGELFGEVLRSLFSSVGSYIIGLTVISLVLVARASFSFIETMRRAGRWGAMVRDRGAWGAQQLMQAWREAGQLELAGVAPGGVVPHIRQGEADVIIAARTPGSAKRVAARNPSSGIGPPKNVLAARMP